MCSGNTYNNNSNGSTCEKCPENFIASLENSYCEPITIVYLKMSDYWCIALLCLTTLGNSFLLLTFVIFKVYKDSPALRSSSQGLCYITMIGTSMFFTLPILVLMKPTATKCKLMPIVVGLTLVINIGRILLIKSFFFELIYTLLLNVFKKNPFTFKFWLSVPTTVKLRYPLLIPLPLSFYSLMINTYDPRHR